MTKLVLLTSVSIAAVGGIAGPLCAQIASAGNVAVTDATAGQPNPAAQAASSGQTGSPATQSVPAGGVEEIVVTAQRRNENLQRVPIAVSAVTSADLTKSGITGIQQITSAVPSLSVQSAAGQLLLHLRGVGTTANGPGFENPVAVYIDGVYYATQTIGLTQFNNVERIEVLKGPQGTLFGRNATGGLVSIITKDPGQTAETSGTISYGNYNSVDAQLYSAGPVSDNLAADFALHFSRHDGYGTNLYNDKSVYGVNHDIAARSKVVWKPGTFKFTLIGDYSTKQTTDNALAGAPGDDTIAGVPAPTLPKTRDVDTDTQPRLEVRGGGVSLKAEAPLGALTVSNLAAYRQTHFSDQFDYDGSPLPLASVLIVQKDRQFSDEFQVSSPSAGRFTWVAGAFYFKARSTAAPNEVDFSSNPLLNPSFPLGAIAFIGHEDTDAIAGFGQGTFKLTDKLRVTGGVRYSRETRKLDDRADGTLDIPGNPIVPIVPTVYKKATFEQPTFRASVDYEATRGVLLYASFNTGFKAGGFNVTVPTDPAYKPEKITAYEIGEKADLFNRKLRINTSAFYYDYRDIQTALAETAGAGIINGAKAHIYGAETEITFVPSKAINISGGATYLHARYTDFPSVAISAPNAGLPVVIGDATGNELPFAPKLALNATATYTVDIGANQLAGSATFLHSSSYFFEPDDVAKQKAYNKVNASLTYTIDGGKYSMALFGNNLSNANVRSIVLSTPSGPRIQSFEAPRTYGVRAGFHF